MIMSLKSVIISRERPKRLIIEEPIAQESSEPPNDVKKDEEEETPKEEIEVQENDLTKNEVLTENGRKNGNK